LTEMVRRRQVTCDLDSKDFYKCVFWGQIYETVGTLAF